MASSRHRSTSASANSVDLDPLGPARLAADEADGGQLHVEGLRDERDDRVVGPATLGRRRHAHLDGVAMTTDDGGLARAGLHVQAQHRGAVLLVVAGGVVEEVVKHKERNPRSSYNPPFMFSPLPDKPDHNALELAILELWDEREDLRPPAGEERGRPEVPFHRRARHREQDAGAAHHVGSHAQGRLPALQGAERLPPALPERLRLPGPLDRGRGREGTRPQLQARDRGVRPRQVRREVPRRRRAVLDDELTEGSIRLGQWMDWGNDYFTFSDTNIEYIWRFLQIVNERDWLYVGHRSTEWCPRCGTSMSAHELAGSYVDRTDPSLTVRFPLTTARARPWSSGPPRPGRCRPTSPPPCTPTPTTAGSPTATGWPSPASAPDDEIVETKKGAELVGWTYTGPVRRAAPAGAAQGHRVGRGVDRRGHRHRPHRAGLRYRRLRARQAERPRDHHARRRSRPVLRRLRLAGRPRRARGGRRHHQRPARARPARARRHDRAPLPRVLALPHPADLPHLRRLVHQRSTRSASRCATPTEPSSGRPSTWASAWTTGSSTWATGTSPGAATTACRCRSIRARAATSPSWAPRRSSPSSPPHRSMTLKELRRPWIDAIKIRCPQCGDDVERITEVGDVWLDAGIVPFSTLGWENPEFIEGGYATGAAAGLTHADLPDHAYWEEWFPADWVSEMREQIRLWFYSQLFMSVVLTGRGAVQARCSASRRCSTRPAARCTARGATMIDAPRRVRAHGRRRDALAVHARNPPTRTCCSASAPRTRSSASCSRCGTSVAFFIQYANIAEFTPDLRRTRAAARTATLEPLDEWMVARTRQLVADATDAYEAFLSTNVLRAFDDFVDDLSNWYVRRSRRRFWNGDDAALRTLWFSLVNALRVVSPVMPFLTEHLWQNLVTGAVAGRARLDLPRRLAHGVATDDELLDEVAAMRTVVELGRRARKQAGIRNRQPLPRLDRRRRAACAASRAGDRRRAERQGGDLRRDRSHRTTREAEPARPRAAPGQGARHDPHRAATTASSNNSTAGGSASPATNWSPTKCSSRPRRRRAGRSRRTKASRSASTRRSTTSSRAKAASTT